MRKFILPKTVADLMKPARQQDLKDAVAFLNAMQRLSLVINSAGKTAATSIQISGGKSLLSAQANIGVMARLLVVAAGGGGGRYYGSGAGGGGVIEVPEYFLLSKTYNITVGLGGVASSAPFGGNGQNGGDSSFGPYVRHGGGGGVGSIAGGVNGLPGGNGSGGGGNGPAGGGAGRDNFNGGGAAGGNGSGGGGGASENGHVGIPPHGGNGGQGLTSDISGADDVYGSGGGGSTTIPGVGGTNAGNGASDTVDATTTTANRGGGGGGGSNPKTASNGASGIVIIRYRGSRRFSGGDITTVGTDTVHTFTASGQLTPR